MAILKPDAVRTEYGLTINEKLIPDSAVWNKNSSGFSRGQQYKANLPLSRGTGKAAAVCIHNTGRITTAAGTTPAEQYTRATWPNCNMGSVRVHYFVDWESAWQNLREDEVGWHAGDGSYGPGNNTTISIEIIMNGSGDEKDKAAERNGALLAAILMRRHGLALDPGLQNHHHYSPGGKNCPVYLLPHWQAFTEQVGGYLEAVRAAADDTVDLLSPKPAPDPEPSESGALYRVQVGAYRNRAYAEAMLEKLRQAGFDGYIKVD